MIAADLVNNVKTRGHAGIFNSMVSILFNHFHVRFNNSSVLFHFVGPL